MINAVFTVFDIMFKVFTHPYLLKMLLDIENILIQKQQQYKDLNVLLTDYLIEAEGPFYKYEPIFSEKHIFEVNKQKLLIFFKPNLTCCTQIKKLVLFP